MDKMMFNMQAELVNELADRMLEVIVESLETHGRDPANGSIVAAAIGGLVNRINYVLPGTRECVTQLLQDELINAISDRKAELFRKANPNPNSTQ